MIVYNRIINLYFIQIYFRFISDLFLIYFKIYFKFISRSILGVDGVISIITGINTLFKKIL